MATTSSGREKVTITIEPRLLKKARREAQADKRTLSSLIEIALERLLQRARGDGLLAALDRTQKQQVHR